jgi:hypothetical protein
MKPSWDKLMDEFKDSTTALIADVDCTVEEELCGKHGVEGYPTIKYGDPADLKDYQGGREYDDLLAFAKESLGPSCGPKHLDLCSEEQKKAITDIQALTDEQIMTQIKEKEDAVAAAEKKFTEEVDKLQAKYEEMNKAKDEEIATIKGSGLSTLVSVCKDRPSCTPPAPPPSEDEEPPPEEDGEEPPEDGEGEEPPLDDDAPPEEDKADEEAKAEL